MLKDLFIIYLKFKFIWVSCTLSGNPTHVRLEHVDLPWEVIIQSMNIKIHLKYVSI